MDVKPILDQHRSERNYVGELLLEALRENMPWGLEVALPNGASAILAKLNDRADASRPYRQPFYADQEGVAITPDTKVIGHGKRRMMFDFKLKHCDQDHIEITAEITGSGGPIN